MSSVSLSVRADKNVALTSMLRGAQCNMARPNAISSLPLLPEIYAQYAFPPLLQINVLTVAYLVS